MLLKNMTVSNYSLGYAKTRNILNTFEKEALLAIFVNTKHLLLTYIEQIFSNNFAPIETQDLDLALEVMNLVVNYPFNSCYLDFTADAPSDTVLAVTFPDSWRNDLIDVNFIRGLVELLKLPQLSGESKLLLVKNISRVVGCKKTLVPQALEKSSLFLHFLLELPQRIIASVDLDETIYLEELVEMMERTINIYSLSSLFEHNDKSEAWIGALGVATEKIMGKCYRVGLAQPAARESLQLAQLHLPQHRRAAGAGLLRNRHQEVPADLLPDPLPEQPLPQHILRGDLLAAREVQRADRRAVPRLLHPLPQVQRALHELHLQPLEAGLRRLRGGRG